MSLSLQNDAFCVRIMQTKYLQIILIGKLFNFKRRKIFGKDVNSFQKHTAMVIRKVGWE